MNRIRRVIINGILALTLFLAISPSVYSAQYHQAGSSGFGHWQQCGSTQKRMDGILGWSCQLNHLFQTSKTGLPTEYGVIEETISPVALKTISDWILKHTTGTRTTVHRN